MNDPLAFVRSLWGGMGVSMPGMVTPTFDVDELDKRIKANNHTGVADLLVREPREIRRRFQARR
jgi:hypothetical protein